jgi:tRNA nucleotidyltransferase/poly(A) polymerase
MAFSSVHLELIETVRQILTPGTPCWLVGGAMRDMLLGRPLHDMDFVLPGGARQMAQAVAHALGGVCFSLDNERDTHRVIRKLPDSSDFYLDFIQQNGDSIQADLAARDFTINALAVELGALDKLVDPLGGLADLRAKCQKACSPGAMLADPVRCLRGIRQASTLGFSLEKDTIGWIKAALPHLNNCSPERIRDEIFRMFEDSHPERALRVLDTLGGMEVLFPELSPLKGTVQTAPHQFNAWDHSLVAVSSLEEIMTILTCLPDGEGKGNWLMGMISLHLGRYRDRLRTYLAESPTPPRTRRALLFLAALYHDAGKPETATTGEDKRRHFYRHERVSSPLAVQRSLALAMSNTEIDWLERVIRHHMRIHHLANQVDELTPRAIYRFFKSTENAGVGVCLLSLADLLATYGTTITREALEAELAICKRLLEAWWERPDELINPPRLLTGSDLIEDLKITPGPLLGELLEAIRVAQVDGKVKSREDGLALAQAMLTDKQHAPDPR